jgi:hypothetical protein
MSRDTRGAKKHIGECINKFKKSSVWRQGGCQKYILRTTTMPKRMSKDNMGTNKHIESHLKRPKLSLKSMLRI